jgi:hypothetical protein
MSPRDADRRVVLERRALFLSSALAAFGGCARSGAPAEHAETPVVALPTESDGDAGAVVHSDAALPPREDPTPREGAMPSLAIPDDVSANARTRYETLARVMSGAHRSIDDILANIPSCGIGECEADWRRVARQVFDLDGQFRFFYVCPGSSEEAKAYAERSEAHQKYYAERRATMDAKIASALGSDPAKKRFEQLIDDVRSANPVPCLSFACRDW